MISVLFLISNPTSLFFFEILGTVPGGPIKSDIIVTTIFYSFFSSRARSKYLFIFLHSFNFTLWFTGTAKPTRRQVFFLKKKKNTRSGLLAGIRWSLYLNPPQKKFMHLILLDGFWFAHILFGDMVKIQFLAQFPVDHLSHPFMPSLVLLYC